MNATHRINQKHSQSDGLRSRPGLPPSGSWESLEFGQECGNADAHCIAVGSTCLFHVAAVSFAAEQTGNGNNVIMADVTLQLVADETFRVSPATEKQLFFNRVDNSLMTLTIIHDLDTEICSRHYVCLSHYQQVAKVIGRRPHQISPFFTSGGSGSPSNTLFLGPPWIFTPNRTSIRSALLYSETAWSRVSERQTYRLTNW